MIKKKANVIEEACDADLPDVLYRFYSEVRKVKGDDNEDTTYSNSTLRCIRSGINRYMKQQRGIDIISDQIHHSCLALR